MNQILVADIAELTHSATWNEGLIHCLASAAAAAGTECAFLALRHANWVQILAHHQVPFHLAQGWPSPEHVNEKFREPLFSSNFREDAGVPAKFKDALPWNYVVNIPIKLDMADGFLTLNCVSSSGPKGRPVSWDVLNSLAQSIKFQLRLLLFMRSLPQSQPQPEDVPASLPRAAEDTGVVSTFLLQTLVNKTRISHAGDWTYVTLRGWRAALKTYQIQALKVLKKNVPESFTEKIGDELVGAVRRVHSASVFSSVAAVPCGNSGPACLASAIAGRVAAGLNIPCVRYFQDLDVSGGSHPRANIRRARMRLREEPTGNILLIDDVVTTGSHLTEAAGLLRSNGGSPTLMGWIGS